MFWRGRVGRGGRVQACKVTACLVRAGRGGRWFGRFRFGGAWLGMAVRASCGEARKGAAWRSWNGTARRVTASCGGLGMDWFGS